MPPGNREDNIFRSDLDKLIYVRSHSSGGLMNASGWDNCSAIRGCLDAILLRCSSERDEKESISSSIFVSPASFKDGVFLRCNDDVNAATDVSVSVNKLITKMASQHRCMSTPTIARLTTAAC